MPRPLSIYVHYPYCSQICSFCAFNKYRLPSSTTLTDHHRQLLPAYKKELRHGLNRLALDHGVRFGDSGGKRQIRSVYFGGGTPSLCPQLVPELLEVIAREDERYQLADNAEITLEANPTSLPSVPQFADSGVTRLSLGAQSLSNSARLKFFNREHDAWGARRALETLVRDRHHLKHGFTFDLMFGNPGTAQLGQPQLEDWSKELQQALPYAQVGGHLSLYELTLEHGTPLARQVKAGTVVMPNADTRADEYDLASSFMTEAGFEHYEVSSFCLPGHESRHNVAFWMGEDLLGVGPGAHGRQRAIQADGPCGAVRTRNICEPQRWAAQVDAMGHGTAKMDRLSSCEFAQEVITVGLRTLSGVSETNLMDLAGRRLDDEIDEASVTALVRQGFLVNDRISSGGRKPSIASEWQRWYGPGDAILRTTDRGRSVLDLILPQILR